MLTSCILRNEGIRTPLKRRDILKYIAGLNIELYYKDLQKVAPLTFK